jgi:hypothetical protein
MPQAVAVTYSKNPPIAISAKKSMCKTSSQYMKKLAKKLGRQEVLSRYGDGEWKPLLTLWNKESRWDYKAKNRHSTAFGIPQMLNMPKDTPMVKQIDLGLKYIKHRYGTPSKALAFHNRHGYY